MFPFDEALAYARLLAEKADALERTYDLASSSTAVALLGWEGRFAQDMRARRLPEEQADLVTVALFGLRREAEEWAEAWADEVNEHNQDHYRRALEEHAQLARAATDLAPAGGPVGVTLAPDPPVAVSTPSAPGFVQLVAFVTYHFEPGADGGGTWRQIYRGEPSGIVLGGWW